MKRRHQDGAALLLAMIREMGIMTCPGGTLFEAAILQQQCDMAGRIAQRRYIDRGMFDREARAGQRHVRFTHGTGACAGSVDQRKKR